MSYAEFALSTSVKKSCIYSTRFINCLTVYVRTHKLSALLKKNYILSHNISKLSSLVEKYPIKCRKVSGILPSRSRILFHSKLFVLARLNAHTISVYVP